MALKPKAQRHNRAGPAWLRRRGRNQRGEVGGGEGQRLQQSEGDGRREGGALWELSGFIPLPMDPNYPIIISHVFLP